MDKYKGKKVLVVGFGISGVAVAKYMTKQGAKVTVTEITGSESFIHVDVGAERWIALVPGVVEYLPETVIDIHLDPDRFFVFGTDGRLAAAPTGAAAA